MKYIIIIYIIGFILKYRSEVKWFYKQYPGSNGRTWEHVFDTFSISAVWIIIYPLLLIAYIFELISKIPIKITLKGKPPKFL